MTGLPSNQPLALPASVSTSTSSRPARKAGLAGAKRTTQRIEATRRLVEELRLRKMTRADMAMFLNFSPSGVRKYLADLRASSLVEVDGEHEVGTGNEQYCLVSDEQLIDSFLAGLAELRKTAPTRIKKSNVDLALRDKTRHIHIIHDDAYYAVRVRRVEVAPDPRALPKDFFKPSGGSIPAPVRIEPVVPAVPTGFAALAVHFELRARPSGVPA